MIEGPVFLLLGPERGTKDAFIQSILGKFRQEYGDSPEIFRFYPFELNIAEVISLLQNGSLFSPKIFVFIHEVDELKGPAASALQEYCGKPAACSVLFLLSDKTNIQPALKKLIPDENVRIFWELFEDQKEKWLQDFFSKSGIVLENGVIDYLLHSIENNTADLKRECQKISQYFGRGTSLTMPLLEDFLYHGREETIFTLFDAVIKDDFKHVLDILEKLLLGSDSNPVQILGGLTWQFKRLLAFSLFQERQFHPDEIFNRLNIRGKRNRQLHLDGCRVYSPHMLRDIIILCSEYDTRLKSVRKEMTRGILQLFLYYTVHKKGKRTAPVQFRM